MYIHTERSHKMKQNKKAAMEMSVGTVVTIVLLMSVMVLGLVLIRNIFSAGEDITKSIENKALDEVDKIFENGETRIGFVPSNGQKDLKRGSTKDGFRFFVYNEKMETQDFIYEIYVSDSFDAERICGKGFTTKEAESWLRNKGEKIESVRKQSRNEYPELVGFVIPKDAPKCTIPYTVTVKDGSGNSYSTAKFHVTIA